ncbi:SpoIIE family protein phosphatase [bacterium]|nr:SpoIIE family protein phosphatase [bacterium]
MGSIVRSIAALVCVSLLLWGIVWLLNVSNPLVMGLLTLAAGIAILVWTLQTQSHDREASLESIEARLAREQNARSQLLASLANDIRKPIIGILDAAQLLSEEDLGYRQRDHVSTIHTSAESLQSLIDDILDLAEVDVGRLKLRPVVFAVRAVIEELLAPYVQQAKLSDHKVSFFVQTRVPESVIGDLERIKHVLRNLLAYVTASDEGDVVMRVSCKSRTEDVVELMFQLTAEGLHSGTKAPPKMRQWETGRGMNLARYQSTSDLGLAISAEIIGLLGGSLWVSEKGANCPRQVSFTCKFPLAGVQTRQTIERTQLGLIPDLPVLIVREKSDRSELEKSLVQWQTVPTMVHDGESMWAKLESQHAQGEPFGLIIIDGHLPKDDSFELCAKLKANQRYSPIPVIMLTTANVPEDAVKAKKAGASVHLLKPVTSARLSNAIMTAVLGRGQYQQMRKDLAAAENYVRALIPPPTTTPLRIDWRWLPATDLAGDALGFHWIDEDHCAFYILDVFGHGLDASLLSVSVLNLLKSMALPNTDFHNPSEVLAQLNNRFPMEDHGDRCFSAWYGIYDRKNSKLTWAGGGHPPALLISQNGEGLQIEQLASKGPLVGMMEDSEFESAEIDVPSGASLFAYSDGVFEIETPAGEHTKFEDFVEFMQQQFQQEDSVLDALWNRDREIRGSDVLDDDFTIIEVKF